MKICLEFDEGQTKILNKICLDGNYSKFLLNFLQKDLFSSLTQSVIKNTPSHILYYEEVSRLIKLVKLTQQEIAKELGFSQQAIAKAFKTQNDRSVIFRTMLQHGTPDNFVYDMYIMALYDDNNGYISLSTTSIIGEIYDYLDTFMKEDFGNRESCVNFITKLNCFVYRIKPKQYDPSRFIQAIKKLDKKLFLNFDISLVEETEERSAERLYTALLEYYLSLEL